MQRKRKIMKNYLKILKNTPLFEGLNDDDILNLLTCLSYSIKTYEKNRIILREGDDISHIAIILNGRVNILKEDYFGNVNIITTLKKADTFAEVFVLSGLGTSEVTAISIEKSKILFLNFEKIISACNMSCPFHNKIIENTVKSLAQKNLLLRQKIEFISKRNIKTKVLSYLSYMAKKNNSDVFTIPFDRQGLADFLYIDRSALSRVLSELKNKGIIDYKKNKFKLIKNLE